MRKTACGISKNALRTLSTNGVDGAVLLIDCMLNSDPESSDALAARSEILYMRKRYQEALECSERSLLIDPENAAAWNTKGNALYMLGRYREAIECYDRAIELEPLFVKAWHNKKLALEHVVSQLRVHATRPRSRSRSRRA
ncbi:MAG: tetratricopeptide repeat protein [Methanothrix sp.]|uniref:tetratricopeptide repeat protein n=1 Tax=Methanothrix sp. TaxID=90426 RepID=UPI0025FCA129|nr:tetratricopeptide repeat protein [Methanothrix sp.]MCQ8903676.1 tetratricopeptide repeat protein [Methanothrix sp.]